MKPIFKSQEFLFYNSDAFPCKISEEMERPLSEEESRFLTKTAWTGNLIGFVDNSSRIGFGLTAGIIAFKALEYLCGVNLEDHSTLVNVTAAVVGIPTVFKGPEAVKGIVNRLRRSSPNEKQI